MNQPEPSNQAKSEEENFSLSATRPCPSCGLEWDKSVATCPQDGTILVSPIETDPAFNKYEFIEVCGVGGMGVVYKARQTALDKVVAIKMLHANLLSPEAVRRFQIEGKTASMLEHPYIIKVHDLGVSASGPYMILEFLRGRTVAQVLQTEGPLSVERFLRVFIQVCSALEHAHNRGVFHRDLKPSNIMLTRSFSNEEEIRIMDFGIAKLIDDSQQEGFVAKLTRTGEAIGSPAYMSPEQAQGGKIDARSDLYSLGCVMFESLTGAAPFDKTTALETLMAHISEQPITMAQAVLGTTEFAPDLETIVARLLQKDPDRRYQSMQELQEHLISVREGQGLGKFVYKQQAPKKNRQLLVITVAAAVIVGALMVIFLVGKTAIVDNRYSHISEPQPTPIKTILLPDPISAAVANNDTELTIGGEGLTVDEDLEPLQRSTCAVRISLRKASISGAGLKYLAKIPTLKVLTLSNSTVQNLEHLSAAQSLESLGLDGTSIGDVQLEQIRNLHLKRLDLANTSVSTLNGLRGMKSLDWLRLSYDQHLGSQGMSAVGQLKNLKELELSSTPIADADLKYIVQLPKLQRLEIYACPNISDGAIDNLKKKLPSDCVVHYDYGHTIHLDSTQQPTKQESKSKQEQELSKDPNSQLKDKADRLYENARYKEACSFYKDSATALESSPNKDWMLISQSYSGMAMCDLALQQNQASIPNFQKAIEIVKAHPDMQNADQLPRWYYYLGLVYDELNRKQEGLAMHKLANDLFESMRPIYKSPQLTELCQSQDKEWEVAKATNLFSIYEDAGLPTAANYAYLTSILEKALRVYGTNPITARTIAVASYYRRLGDLYVVAAQQSTDQTVKERDLNQSLVNYQRAKKIATDLKQDPLVPGELAASTLNIAEVSITLQHYDSAESILKGLLKHKNPNYRKSALLYLVALYQIQHRTAEQKKYAAELAKLPSK